MGGRSSRRSLVAAAALAVLVVAAGVVVGPALVGPAAPSAPVEPALGPVHPVRIVGLGDSIPAAFGCACTGFLDLYADALGAARPPGSGPVPATVTNFAIGGWTTADLLSSLAPDHAAAEAEPDGVSRSIGQADIITVMIGANDYDALVDTFADGRCGGPDGLACFDSATEDVTRGLTAILQRIRELRDGRPTTLQVLGYWDVFPDGEFAQQAYGAQFVRDSTKVTQLANTAIADVARAEQACYVDLYAPFKGPDGELDDTSLLIDDGEHPNQAGHQRIADVLAAAACPQITPSRAVPGPS